jgi:methylenetetrahydrofolate dehydrogenase (NADP+)/methenyltetrahydrofolate cyclohydrolase
MTSQPERSESTTIILDGKSLAAEIRTEIARDAARLREEGRPASLATVLVGEDPGSVAYVRAKHKDCAEVGIESVERTLPESASQAEIEAVVEELNQDPAVSGFIVQLPLPPHIDESAVLRRIDPSKDVDGLHPQNLGRLALDDPLFLPCTPLGICTLLEHYGVPIEGADAVILGRGRTVGRPLSMLLSSRSAVGNATVTLCHTRTRDLMSHVKRADIVVAAMGVAGMIEGSHIKEGAAVVDVGITRTAGGLVGDVDRESVEGIAGWLAPMPGGVGPMTRAMLLRNTIEAARRRP